MKRLVLIDFQNFLFRCLKVNYQANGINKENVNVVYGFFKNLYDLMIIMESGGYDCDYICCNDNGYDARYKLSEDAVRRGIIAKTYKEDRRYIAACASDEEKAEKEENKRQAIIIKELLNSTKVKQAFLEGEEADDICGSLANQNYDKYDSIVLVTSDQDYYQLKNDKVVIYNSIKKEWIGEEEFKNKFELSSPSQWIDRGALLGDKGDTIIGLDGCGEVKSLKYIKQYGTLGNFIENAEKLIADLKAKYNGDVNSLCDAVYSKEEKTSIDKLNFKLIAEKEKILLAYELKKIRTELNVKLFGGFSDEKNLRIRLDELGVSLGERYFDKFIESKNMSRIISDLNKRRNLF
jgi:5'-3' exonuclease